MCIISDAILPQSILSEYDQSNKNVLIPQNIKGISIRYSSAIDLLIVFFLVNQNQSNSVVPVIYTLGEFPFRKK